jgi:hypothetical protein
MAMHTGLLTVNAAMPSRVDGKQESMVDGSKGKVSNRKGWFVIIAVSLSREGLSSLSL